MKHAMMLTGAAALALIAAGPAGAQTVITPDTQPAATTGTTATRAGTATLIDGGRRVGDNLFHSFSAFSLGSGESAVWVRAANDGGSIANVINRVTGGTISTIDGTIASRGLDRANFFFINPAGIVFGANASVAVPNAAYFSTASNLRFADGAVFGVTTPSGSSFSMAAPSAFGFLGGQGDIAVRGVGNAFAGANTRLALSAANISIDRSRFSPGALDLLALGGATRLLALDQPLAARFAAGNLALTDSFISVQPSATLDGRVRANAGRITLNSTILSSDSNERSAAGLQMLAGDLVLRTAPGGAFRSYLGSFADDDGNAATVAIDAARIVVANESQIGSQALDGARGNAGDISIRAQLLQLETGGAIISSAYGNSLSGSINIVADSIAITSGGLIETTTFGAGKGGDLLIEAGSLTMDGGLISAEAEATASGDAGTISILAGAVRLDNGARITSSNLGSGFGGFVGVTADTITLANRSSIQADSIGGRSSGAGAIGISAGTLRIESGSEISSITEGSGQGGTLLVRAERLIIDNGALNSAALGGTGAAGIIVVQAGALTMRNNAGISTSTLGSGAAGLVRISARSIDLSSGARISSETFSSGRAGDIVIEPSGDAAPDITITGRAQITSSQRGNMATGDAGTITITANHIYLGPSGTPAIRTDTFNSGNAGAIIIAARSIDVDGAQITSSNGFLPGSSGAIDITADTLLLRNGSQIDTTSFNRSTAGAIRLAVGALTVDGSSIRSANGTVEGGAAGSILIEANRIDLVDGGEISTNSANGAAGDITLLMPRTGTLVLRGAQDAGVITTSSGPGTGGVITITSPYLILSDGGRILALGEAFGADVLLQSDFYIRSSDRLNLLSVDGGLLVDSQVGDLSTGAEQVDLSFLDASSVLRGQCAPSRRGGGNQLNLRPTGPYAGAIAPVESKRLVQARVPVSGNQCPQ